MNKIEKELLEQIADLHSIPTGAFSLRKNGKPFAKQSTDDIEIIAKKNKPGIDIYVKAGTKNKSLHIPVIILESGIKDLVYNDFYIGEESEILIVAGCGIHNNGKENSEHNGIHTFHLDRNANVKYIEKHLGLGKGQGEKILNPVTKIFLKENATLEMQTIQLGGVSSSIRNTSATLSNSSKLLIEEKILTTLDQTATTNFKVELLGKNSSVEVVSRSVAKDNSKQTFNSNVIGKNTCFGHVECDGIILDNAKIFSSPKISALNVDATLVHEAAIGKIAGEQLIKLETLGLSEKQAEELIIKGFLS